MGFIHRRTSKQTNKVKTLLGLALSRLAAARRPRLARKSISRSDVGQLLALSHLDRALHRAEQLIEEDNMLEAFNIIELYCNRLIEHAKQLDKPHECGEDIREAAAGIMFAAGRCSDLPELLFARTILANKFGGDFAMMAKEGTGVVDPMLVWKLSGNKRNTEMKKKVVKEIAVENNVLLDFSEFQEVVEQDGSSNVPHHHELNHQAIYQIDMDESSESDSYHSPSRNKDPCDMSNSDGANNGHPKQKNMKTSAERAFPIVPSTHRQGSAPVEEGSGKGRADAGGRWRRLRSSPSASTKLVAAPATKGSPTEDLTAVEPWHEVAQSVFGAGGAMDSVSDCQAKEAEQVVEEGDAGDTIKGNYQPPEPVAEAGQVVEEGDAGVSMEGVASIALLPTGAISGHFIRLPGSVCYGLHGTPISCERECSRGEDYRLIKLTIIDFKSKREKVLVVECRGHDAARLQNIDHLHGWEDDIVGLVEKEHGNQKVLLSFECETLKADKDAEDHITKYMPNLRGLDAVVNIGKMSISGINLDEDDEPSGGN